MAYMGRFYLDKEKDIIVELDLSGDTLSYVLHTPNHATGNLITNLARLCDLPLSMNEEGLKVIRGTIPCYIDDWNRQVYVFRLGDTKVANIWPDGSVERKAAIPAISKTLMSQTKDYRLDFKKTLVKTYIRRECKFHTDLHTHMNANLDPDLLIALGIHHQIRYPLYYIKKLKLRCTDEQWKRLEEQRKLSAEKYKDCGLTGKYLTRRIDDHTFINFADLILNNLENAPYNLPRIRASLAILKDGQAVFTNLEKVYLYRYVFTKGIPSDERISLDGAESITEHETAERTGPASSGGRYTEKIPGHETAEGTGSASSGGRYTEKIPDREIADALRQMEKDRQNPAYASFSLFQDKLLWIARSYASRGVIYAEISDTTLVKSSAAAEMLRQVHEAMPAIERETGVTIRFLAAIRRIALTLVKDQISAQGDFPDQLRTLRAIAMDPYVAGSDIIGEEINDVRDLRPVLRELVKIAGEIPGFVLRIHAGENDSLRDNVANSLRCVLEELAPGQSMPPLRIGHGLYTANLNSARGQKLIRDLRDNGVVLEFQITSNVRLNNLSTLTHHPLKQYLAGGIACVQGTDGGALYGTDSIDEQLSLEKLLELNYDEMLAMRRAEDQVREQSMYTFHEKMRRFADEAGETPLGEFLEQRIAACAASGDELSAKRGRIESTTVFRDQIREMPVDKVPVILLGGSFNSDQHTTRMYAPLEKLLTTLVEQIDPQKAFFVIGHRMTAYEKKLAQAAAGKFDIFAIVPTQVTESEAKRLQGSGVGIRVSIEPTGMGLYKSFAYEIFKRRPSVVIAMDGNSAGANTVQEAKNGKRKARIFVSRHSRLLSAKARTLKGYVQLFNDEEAAGTILAAVEDVWNEMNSD